MRPSVPSLGGDAMACGCSGRGLPLRTFLDIQRCTFAPQRKHLRPVSRESEPPRSASSYSFNFQETGPEPVIEQQQPEQPRAKPVRPATMNLTQPPPVPQSRRDSEGRSLAGRKKPLKINLDLSLYRARQIRIEANRSRIGNDRSRLFREAEVALRRCLAMDPEDGRSYVSLGKILVQQRRFDEASALYEAGSAATGGTNAHIWTAWAYLAGRRGNVALARKLYDAAIVASPIHAAAYHGWGLLEKGQGNFARARDVWIRGIEATGGAANPYLYQSLAVLAADLDRPEEARRWFRVGTKTLTGAVSHALWQAWALLEQRQGTDPEIVRTLFRKGLQVSPRSRYTFLSWALWEKEQGNLEEARRLLRTGTHTNPRDPALPQAWALLEAEQGNFEEARRLFRRASKADPSHLYVWQAWGCMEQRAGSLDAARELFQQGIWAAAPRARDASLIFQAWAVLEREAGNFKLARELFKCAVKADSRSEPSWLAWADMEEELGALDRAAELRGFSMQERQEIAAPANFTTLPQASKENVLSPLFEQLNKWFLRYEAAGRMVGPLPGDSTDDDGANVRYPSFDDTLPKKRSQR